MPPKLEEAVSRVLETSRPRVAWLKRSLRTKDPREANIKAKPVLMEFDRILASAATYLRQRPLVTQLSEIEIERFAASYQYASMLEEDEEVRRDGTGSEELFQAVTKELMEAGAAFVTPLTSDYGKANLRAIGSARNGQSSGRTLMGHLWLRRWPSQGGTFLLSKENWMSCLMRLASTGCRHNSLSQGRGSGPEAFCAGSSGH